MPVVSALQGRAEHAEVIAKNTASAGGGPGRCLQRAAGPGSVERHHQAPGHSPALSGTGHAAIGALGHSEGRAGTAWRVHVGA